MGIAARRTVHVRRPPLVTMLMLDKPSVSGDFTVGALYPLMERAVTPAGLQRMVSVPLIEAIALKPMAYHCSTPFTAVAPVIVKSKFPVVESLTQLMDSRGNSWREVAVVGVGAGVTTGTGVGGGAVVAGGDGVTAIGVAGAPGAGVSGAGKGICKLPLFAPW